MQVGWSRIMAIAVAAVVLVSCGGNGDGDEPATPAETGADEAAEAADDATTESPQNGTSDDESAVDEPVATATIQVDPSALSTDASGFDTLTEDLCALYSVEALDAFFEGAGELTTSEPIDGGCSWSVEGLPRSHYVNATLTDEGSVFGIAEGERVDVAGVEVHLQRGPGDAWATVPTPDGRFIAIRVHGDFDVEGRALDGALDPAALGLADNLVDRL